ncbi:unnamed protein product [Ceutorhynchus assimilis]|uniref:Uncharacterized protein n=1 Tax=Ceutorhynchus assimilis TaxID=467358 RepID=A0A9N9MCI4_9CUCU|nr:unnamed protein product [Ceutorhynchus assimilis]
MEDIVNLRVENIESNNLVDELNEDNNALHILIATLEESLINMGELVDGQHRIIMNSKMREIELVNKLRKLNIVVTENENTLDNFFQDAEEARKSVVGLKTLYDKKAQQCNKLQKSFEEYKRKFNEESFEAVKQDLVVSKKKEEELQKELQQMKKLNDLMTQEARQHTF